MSAEFLIPWAAVPLRIILGILYIIHGYPKIKSPTNTAGFFKTLNIPMPFIAAIVVAIVEFFGGITLILGFGTRIAAALLAINMSVATILKKTKMNQGFVGGYEFDLVLVITFIALFLLGAGNLSIDKTIGWLLG